MAANFDIGDPFDFAMTDSQTENFLEFNNYLLQELFDDSMPDFVASSNVKEEMIEMNKLLQSAQPDILPGIDEKPVGRFKKLKEIDLNIMEEARQSSSTKKNTKWGVKLFQGRPILNLI